MNRDLKRLAFVGIDPGTTTAVVAINIFGDIVFSKAAKHYKIKDIIRDIKENLDPVMICTDKANIPKTVQEVASKLGLRIYHPKRDLSIDDKLKLTSDISFKGKFKEHLLDALASARYAYEAHKRIIERSEGKERRYEILKIVLRNPKYNIDAAMQKIKEENYIKRPKIKKSKKAKKSRKTMSILEKVPESIKVILTDPHLVEENKKLKKVINMVKEYLINSDLILVKNKLINGIIFVDKIDDKTLESCNHATTVIIPSELIKKFENKLGLTKIMVIDSWEEYGDLVFIRKSKLKPLRVGDIDTIKKWLYKYIESYRRGRG